MRRRRPTRLSLDDLSRDKRGAGGLFPGDRPLWDKMMRLRPEENAGPTKTGTKFRALTEAQVLQALEIDNSATAVEVARLVSAYFSKFRFALERQGPEASTSMVVDVNHPIEKVAVVMLMSFVEQEFSARRPESLH